jgi:hypothetical protein
MNYTSNNSGTIIPISDSPAPLLWTSNWLPMSILPPDNITPFKVIINNYDSHQSCIKEVDKLLCKHPELKKLIVGVFILFVPPNQFNCRIYLFNLQTLPTWTTWKNNASVSISNHSDLINGIFYVYRPWFNNSQPIKQDKDALVWMMPFSRLPETQTINSIHWSCPKNKIHQCAIDKKKDKNNINLTFRDNVQTNQPGQPCFLHTLGCQGELNIKNRNLTINNQYCPNTQLPLQLKDNELIINNNNRLHPFQFNYLYSSVHRS